MLTRLVQLLFLGLIHTYRHTLGYFMGGQCRYQPTCSLYGLEAIREWGPWRGGWMALRRIGRCHPFVKGGFDPVPVNPCHEHGTHGTTMSAPAALSTNTGDKK